MDHLLRRRRERERNVDGKQRIMFTLTFIECIGHRFANIADINMNKSAGELSAAELKRFVGLGKTVDVSKKR
ncbi:hypothetical protein ZIOFF_053311 [Zingiber officinale]|uniref:Uncharacterized protein n=2 Tax=Zingiber officinale TaxID=94328 RepID=A0A8J5FCA2_ZINOF|nr:hypothetical protein ZIOFF_053311 [Zingiber officinale]